MDRLYLAGFYTLKFLIFLLPSSLQNMLAKFSDAHQAVSDAKELFELANSENDER